MRWDNPNLCSICDSHYGVGSDHTECAAIKKEDNKNRKIRSNRKKLNRKDTDYMGIQANKLYD